MKKDGITLITLIITIIVMLILAGAVIGLMSSSGLLTMANSAAMQARIDQAKEKIELEIAYVQAQKNGQATMLDLIYARSSRSYVTKSRRRISV